MISPCKGCQVRHESCHSGCDKYKDWLIDLEATKAKISKARNLDRISMFRKPKHSNWYNT